MNADSASNACCSSSPLTTSWQRSPFKVLVPIIASALFAFPRPSVRVFNHSTEDEKVLHSVSTRLAGRACTPLGKSHMNSITRAIAFLLNNAYLAKR
jgi:hypothetical protein